jgi:hypothetical protein
MFMTHHRQYVSSYFDAFYCLRAKDCPYDDEERWRTAHRSDPVATSAALPPFNDYMAMPGKSLEDAIAYVRKHLSCVYSAVDAVRYIYTHKSSTNRMHTNNYSLTCTNTRVGPASVVMLRSSAQMI